MPASDQSAIVLVSNLSDPYNRGRYKPDNLTETNLFKLARAASVALHAETGQCIDDLEPEMFAFSATQGFLDNQAVFWQAARQPAETDASLRLRIGQQKLVKWGAFNVDDMLVILANLLRTTPDTIDWTENINEDGRREPALIAFTINPHVFTALGLTDVAGALASLRAKMELAPAGVRVILAPQGSAMWDDGATTFDGDFTWSG